MPNTRSPSELTGSPDARTLVTVFADQVRTAPEALAVRDGDRVLTYAALDRAANRVAQWLHAHGLRDGDPVGLVAPKSLDLLVAILGVVKAGGAYVPVDVDYPAERQAHMIRDAGIRLIVTHAAVAARLPEVPGVLGTLDLASDALDGCADTPVDAAPGPGAVACMFYTSGSTGRPKGAALRHESLIALALNPDTRVHAHWNVGFTSNVSFDAATYEVWGAWLNGASLHVMHKDVVIDSDALARTCHEGAIRTALLTTSVFHAHAHRRPDAFGSFELLLVGGEPLDSRACARVMRSSSPPRRLVNVYGPTECTTFSVIHDVPATWGLDPADLDQRVPIGHPTKGDQLYIVDAQRQPIADGETGELLIGGIGVGNGYLNRPELTAERFLPDPARPGHLMYRTGDLVRRRADGLYECLGRMDQQIKIRGLRIELGEIESELCRVPGVHRAAVVLDDSDALDPRLHAYLELTAGTTAPSPRALRDALSTTLPPHMVPTAFVPVPAFPLTPNGKLDRRALPAPGPEHRQQIADAVVATDLDATERMLHTIWTELLGVAAVDPDESFITAGGHSLLAVRLLDRIAGATGQTVRLSDLLEADTIRRQAALLRNRDERASMLVPITSGGQRPPLFFVTGWGGPILPLKAIGRALGLDQPLYLIDAEALVDTGDVSTLTVVAARMLAEIRRVQPRGPYLLAGYSLGGEVVYEIAQQLRAAGDGAALVALLDNFAPGYPRHASLPMRLLRHAQRALAQGPAGMWPYIATHGVRARRFVGKDIPRLFTPGRIDEYGSASERMERVAQAMYSAWKTYRAAPYPGTVTLLRANDIIEIGVTAVDLPDMGWHSIAGDVRLAGGIDCRHSELLAFEHAPALGRLLRSAVDAALDEGPPLPQAPSSQRTAPAPSGFPAIRSRSA